MFEHGEGRGRGHAAAVFTSDESGEHEREVNAAIGRVAAEAVDHLRTMT